MTSRSHLLNVRRASQPQTELFSNQSLRWNGILALIEHRHPSVRLAVATNPTTPHVWLEKMAKEETDPGVLEMIEARRDNLAQLISITEGQIQHRRGKLRTSPIEPREGELDEDELEVGERITGVRSNNYADLAESLTAFAAQGRRFGWLLNLGA